MREKYMLRKDDAQGDEVIVKTPHRHLDLLVAPICILIAFLVWLCVMNVRDTAYVRTDVLLPVEGYTYELSSDSLEVEGNVVALKRAERIGVIIPSNEPGVYVITEENLVLPEGVSLTSTLRLTLTVRVE